MTRRPHTARGARSWLTVAVASIALVASVVGVASLSGCAFAAAGADAGAGAGTGAAAGAPLSPGADPGLAPLDDGFLGGQTSPSPEATINPETGSWSGVHPPAGYRVVLITAGTDAPTETLIAAIGAWADREGVDLEQVTAADDDEVEDRLDEAVASSPDLVLGAGNGVIDVFALLTGQHLAQQFLVVGAELPEPTGNVTAVIWPGASFRGTGLGTSGEQDDSTFTPERADAAVSAGVASVLHGVTGIVVYLG
ncbi:BMP family ABC transporter substrate-binding protein [Herbiconiux sp. P17]|uniref:BMP family ABC transporter substrate-binding protein n=1 Tax=Herbiconiux wuyangfengii TaxID=3342794 RepID=UPI0035B6D230